LDNRIKTLGLTGKVMLAGFRDDVPALMYHLYVFCLLSDYEGTPNVILEAMAAARPVVATRVGGIPDLVQDNVTGFLVKPGDVDGFANAVKRLLDDPALADRMGLAGQEIVKRDYSCETIAHQLEQIYMQSLEVHQ
jgi:glycosyltransferase involved in cell wall biosynthesis